MLNQRYRCSKQCYHNAMTEAWLNPGVPRWCATERDGAGVTVRRRRPRVAGGGVCAMCTAVYAAVCAPRCARRGVRAAVCAPRCARRGVRAAVCAPRCARRGVRAAVCVPWCARRGVRAAVCAHSAHRGVRAAVCAPRCARRGVRAAV